MLINKWHQPAIENIYINGEQRQALENEYVMYAPCWCDARALRAGRLQNVSADVPAPYINRRRGGYIAALRAAECET